MVSSRAGGNVRSLKSPHSVTTPKCILLNTHIMQKLLCKQKLGSLLFSVLREGKNNLPGDHVLSELSTMTHQAWVALQGMFQ